MLLEQNYKTRSEKAEGRRRSNAAFLVCFTRKTIDTIREFSADRKTQHALRTFSEEFYTKHRQQLEQGVGEVFASRSSSGSRYESKPPHTTIIFDARENHEYVWELKQLVKGCRKIWQLTSGPLTLEGNCLELDTQGRLLRQKRLNSQEKEQTYKKICMHLAVSEVAAAFEEPLESSGQQPWLEGDQIPGGEEQAGRGVVLAGYVALTPYRPVGKPLIPEAVSG